MVRLSFYKKSDKEYNCTLSVFFSYLHKTSSNNSYQEAGEKMFKYLNQFSKEGLGGNFFLLSGLSGLTLKGIENPKEEELNEIKKSLETFIQENKWDVNLGVKK